MRVQISVSEGDIRDAMRGSQSRCPIARATLRQLPLELVRVMGRDIYFLARRPGGPDMTWGMWCVTEIVALPPEAQQFVKDFDGGRPVRPFSFSIDVNSKWSAA